jgi:hypothetical protein
MGASFAGEIRSLARLETDPDIEELVRGAYETLTAAGEEGYLSTVAANLAQVLYASGDYDRAEELTLEAKTIGVSDDIVTQVGWRTARAMVLARWGRHAEAEALAREAIARRGSPSHRGPPGSTKRDPGMWFTSTRRRGSSSLPARPAAVYKRFTPKRHPPRLDRASDRAGRSKTGSTL